MADDGMVRTLPKLRPTPVLPTLAGRRQQGGWLDVRGRFYPAAYLQHIETAALLRATGDGPSDPWIMRDGWVMVKSYGEVIALPGRLTQPQIDSLGDMLCNAPDDLYRKNLLTSLRNLQRMEELVG